MPRRRPPGLSDYTNLADYADPDRQLVTQVVTIAFSRFDVADGSL